MNLLLAVIGGLIGLAVTGAAVYTVWAVRQLWKQQAAAPKPASQVEIAAVYFLRWTFLDYAVVGLFIVGLLLLLAELFAVLRDRSSFESFHFAYLLTGIVLSAMGMLLLFARLLAVLGFVKSNELQGLQRSAAVAPNHQHEPHHADRAE
ncbi:hypothetical protein [Paenibacillus aestuarii]|uniref:DUF4064 domain-containing protein n=1 Tax=Paenibacillus aestuarii TaxID=516965 RepID=A0ABW0KGA5_9BACL|nr:hypothetical protein [Paenibacillus aestuarii]